MRWYKDLYVSENITGSLKYIQFMVDHGLQVRPLYLIVLSEISDGQLEIIPVATLKIPIFRHKSYDHWRGKGLLSCKKSGRTHLWGCVQPDRRLSGESVFPAEI